MKYTMSEDGEERCTVLVRLRLTRDEMRNIRKLVEMDPCSTGVRDWLEGILNLAVEEELTENDGRYDQTVGRGG